MGLFLLGVIIILGTLIFMKFGREVANEHHWVKSVCLLLLLLGAILWVGGLASVII